MIGALGKASASKLSAQQKFDLKAKKLDLKAERSRLKYGIKEGRVGIKQTEADTAQVTEILAAQTDAGSAVAAAEVDATDASARAKLLAALPWVLGAVVVIGLGAVLLKKKGGRR